MSTGADTGMNDPLTPETGRSAGAALPEPRPPVPRGRLGLTQNPLFARLASIQRRLPLMQAAALALLFAYGAASLDGFSRYSSIKTMLIIAAFLGIAAVGQQIVILIGGVDLSVPAFITVGNFMVPQLAGIHGWPFGLAVVAQIVVAIAIGAGTGWICNRFKVEPLVVTLGVGTVVIGAVAVWTNGLVDAGVPAWVSRLTSPATDSFGLDIPPIVVIWAVIAILMAVLLHKTVIGRRIYASGANPRAAEVGLVPVRRVWMFAFALSAVAASFAGLMLAGFSGTGNIRIGDTYLFSSLASVIVGGTALVGARGDYWRTVLGAILLTMLTTILIGHGLGQGGQQVFYGLVILLVVPAYGRDRRTADRI
ncbi:ABC transporter permease [Conexibacter sp. CPCC 206217]|uniref:ABC transporter permease n=1 Tax=Conexibacter sp. CPCC 206217 TaxID=3064574 RepID=UPI002723DAC6|nr:ABC transporter permease [Conexibacter sp. CPCC 206217]MDO8213140.1 ABC transporter permease [Conexibacter sp. CPCC 206217]